MRAVLAGLVLGAASCEKTDFARGYSERLFGEIAVGQPVEEVIQKLGEPLSILRYSLDYERHPLPSGQHHEVVAMETLSEASREPHRYVALYYSLQHHPHRDWWRNQITVADGRVTKTSHELVTE
jgi:hypothetical protein